MRIGSRLGVLLQVLAGLVVTVLLLAAIELAAGFVVRGPQAPTPEIPGDTVSRTLTWLELNPAPLVRDVDLLWRNEPGARKTQLVNPQPFGREQYWTIENNSEGLRGPERARAGGEVYRILCVGDSVTFGFNVDQPDAYPRQLQALLEARYPTRRFEVVNGGVPGWSWLQGLHFLETQGLAMRPDLVIMGHGTNDQFLPAKITDEERLRLLAGPVTRAVQSAVVLVSHTNTYQAIERFLPSPSSALDKPSPGCEVQIRERGSCHRVSLDEIAAAAREANRAVTGAGVDVLFLGSDFTETPAIEGLRRAVDGDQLPFLDVVDVVRRLRRQDEEARALRLGLAPPSPRGAAWPAPVEAARRKRVLLRVVPREPAGSVRVEGGGYYQPQFAFAEPAYDDGTHGDEKRGDGVYSVALDVPGDIRTIRYLFYQDGNAEFRPLPPLSGSVGDRLLPVPGDVVAPVDVFAERLFMAEGAHPDREGQRVVATHVADRIATVPSFRRFVDAGRQTGAPGS